MKVGYAVQGHIVAQQPPRDCARLSVMERIECVRKMGYVTRSRFESQVEDGRGSLRMTYEHAHAVARELTREEPALHLRRQGHQARAERSPADELL